MDFKSHFKLDYGYCHPLTILDDHSRFLVGLHACSNQLWQTVQAQLVDTFRIYGLPECMLMDNGSPWGDSLLGPYTVLSVWLMRLGVAVTHGRPYHPQTQGKDERLHRTLQAEVIDQVDMHTLGDCQTQFDAWRNFYNLERPHQALGNAVPAERYQPSLRKYPESLPSIQYDSADIVRTVDINGDLFLYNHKYVVGKAFRHCRVALRPTEKDGTYDVYFCQSKVALIHLQGDNS
jgi:transposase InsO family protein